MAILVFLLSLALLAAGAASGYASLDLLPTGLGVLYALAGAVAVAAAIVTFALGIAIRRIDGLAKLMRQTATQSSEALPAPRDAPVEPALAAILDSGPAAERTEPSFGISVPPAETPETGPRAREGDGSVLETPESPPTMIGRYTSGGANYMIFADGSIEAETTEGKFRFPSIADFKRFLIDRKSEQPG